MHEPVSPCSVHLYLFIFRATSFYFKTKCDSNSSTRFTINLFRFKILHNCATQPTKPTKKRLIPIEHGLICYKVMNLRFRQAKMNYIERQFGVLITRFAFVYKVFISSVCLSQICDDRFGLDCRSLIIIPKGLGSRIENN